MITAWLPALSPCHPLSTSRKESNEPLSNMDKDGWVQCNKITHSSGCVSEGHGAEGAGRKQIVSPKNGNYDEQRTKRQIMGGGGGWGKNRAQRQKCKGERGDWGGALMDRVKKEQTEERGGEGAALGQWCVETNHLHLSSNWAECSWLLSLCVCERASERESVCDMGRGKLGSDLG